MAPQRDPVDLMEGLRARDGEALRELYGLFGERVFNTAISYVQNREEAEEVTQDVFVEVFHAAAQFKGESSVSTWIYRIAVNKSLDRLRYKSRKKRFAFVVDIFKSGSSELRHAAHFEHPGVAMENKEKAAILFSAIGRLPANQKTAFILSYVEELPQKEVAEVMKLSVKAVESLIQRAKASLRKELAGMYEGRRK